MAIINLHSVRLSPKKDKAGRHFHLLFKGYQLPNDTEYSFDFTSAEITKEKGSYLPDGQKEALKEQITNDYGVGPFTSEAVHEIFNSGHTQYTV